MRNEAKYSTEKTTNQSIRFVYKKLLARCLESQTQTVCILFHMKKDKYLCRNSNIPYINNDNIKIMLQLHPP